MPVFTSAGSTIVQFGHGDIIISKARNTEKSHMDEICLIADSQQTLPVGSFVDKERWEREFADKLSSELNAPVRLAFENVESLDALVTELTELRELIVTAQKFITAS